MSSLGTECRLTLDCADDNPFTYVFVETLQLLQDWLSEREHFDKVLQVACWEKRDKLAALLRAFGEEMVENRTDTVPGKILREVLKYYRPCRHARILFDSMLRPEIEAMVIHLIERGFELIASRFDDHVLEARAASGRDVLKCLFNILFGVITTYSYYVDILSTAVDNGHETAIRNTLKDASVRYRLRGKGGENEDICQKLFNAAVCSGNSELVRILLQLPQLRRYVKVNGVIDTTKAGDTALHLACRMGSTLINQAFEDYLCPKAVRLALFPESESDQKQAVRRTSPSLRIMSLVCSLDYYRFVAAAAATGDECRGTGLDEWKLMAMSSEMQKLQLNTHFAEYVELVQLLIREGAEPNATNRNGETALHVAASLQLHGDVLLQVYALCRRHVSEKDLRWKRSCGLLGALKTLREKKLTEDETQTSFTCIVSELFSPSTVQLLNPVVSEYFENATGLVRSLLQTGMDVDVRSSVAETALSVAADEASKCIEFCRQMHTTVDCQLYESAAAVGEFLRANVFTVVRELLIHNADWRICKSNGVDLLNLALRWNQTELLVELVCRGAEPVSWPEYLILVLESENRNVANKTLATLSSIGVTVDIRNDVGQTALHIAAERDLSGVVKELIDLGADTEAVDNAGQTPKATTLRRSSLRSSGRLAASE